MLGIGEQAWEFLRSHPLIFALVAAGLFGLWLWYAYRSSLKRHPAKVVTLEVGGVDGRIGLLNSAIKTLDFGYGVLDGDGQYWATAYDDMDRRHGGQLMITVRSKKRPFDPASAELTEHDLQMMGIRVDADGNWPASIKLRIRPASRLSLSYWWDHNDFGTKLSVRLTAIVLFLQEVVFPVVKPETFRAFVWTVDWIRKFAGF
jgi:hypothetical protein